MTDNAQYTVLELWDAMVAARGRYAAALEEARS